MPTNDLLFVKVLAQIEKHPETWHQRYWINDCGTAFCFAGWAVTLSGYRIVLNADGMPDRVVVRGRPRWVGDIAAELLGGADILDDWRRGEYLFGPWNTLNDLYRISAQHMGIDEQVLRDKVAAEVQS